MRLQMIMKRPVFFPDLDPMEIPSFTKASTLEDAFQAYCEAMLEANEPCMEASESARQIVTEIRKLRSELSISRCSADSYTLSNGSATLVLSGNDQEQVFLEFSKEHTGIELSDFGPKDAAAFIMASFASYDKIVSGINHKNNSLYS